METIIETRPAKPEALEALVERAAVDRQAFTQLYRYYLPRIYGYVLSRVEDQAAAEDISGQVFLTILQKLPKLRDPQRFNAWIFRIARNKCMDHFRALKRDRIRIQALGWLFEEATVSRDDLNDLEKAFQSLPELEQDILRLRFLGDMSLKEVAQVLQQTEGGLKSRYYRCLEKLQLSMEGKHDEL
jgi:RNA polymerase sigma-70 factor (ECF subfamily)